ncbi:MAG: hypothetical protein M0Z86_01180, partial [Deltaproteobacteria bacterium]|nr:hypothetical protein [Deltaproteobacteria bacterium]
DMKYQRISSPLLMLELTLFRLFNIPRKKDVQELINGLNNLKTAGGLEAHGEHTGIAEQTGLKNNDNAAPMKNSNLTADKPSESTNGNGVSLEHEKLFDHFLKTDEKLNEFNKKTETEPLKNIIGRLGDDSQSAAYAAEKKDTGGVIEDIKEIFGSGIERIEKN